MYIFNTWYNIIETYIYIYNKTIQISINDKYKYNTWCKYYNNNNNNNNNNKKILP